MVKSMSRIIVYVCPRIYYQIDLSFQVSGRRFVYKFVASPEMQAAVNAIKTHMVRGGMKRIPAGPFPHYQQYLEDVKREAVVTGSPQDIISKPYGSNNTTSMYHHHSRPGSISPRLEYGRSSRSPPVRSRSPHHHNHNHNHRLSDPEDHYHHHNHRRTGGLQSHPQGSIVLEHSSHRYTPASDRDPPTPPPPSHHTDMVVHPKESTYYRGGVGEINKRESSNSGEIVKRESDSISYNHDHYHHHDRKRRHSDHEMDQHQEEISSHRYRYTTDPNAPPPHRSSHSLQCAHRVVRRNSSSGYQPSHHHIKRHDSPPPPPDNRLSLYEENARKFAEERLKVLDRFHFGRDTGSLFRRPGGGGGSPGPYERREVTNVHGGGSVNHRNSHRDSPTARSYDNSRRSPYERDDRSSPNHHHQHQQRSQYKESGHSPKGDDSMYHTPAIVLSTTNYLPTGGAVKKDALSSSPSSPTQRRRHQREQEQDGGEERKDSEPVCYMYRRYSPMIDVSTQTESSTSTAADVTASPTTPDTTDSGPVPRAAVGHLDSDKDSDGEDSVTTTTADLLVVKKEQEDEEEIVERESNGFRRREKRIPSPINTKACENNEHISGAFEFHNGVSDKDHHHHYHLDNETGNHGHCKCGCMETIESPSGTGTVVVYPKEIV